MLTRDEIQGRLADLDDMRRTLTLLNPCKLVSRQAQMPWILQSTGYRL